MIHATDLLVSRVRQMGQPVDFSADISQLIFALVHVLPSDDAGSLIRHEGHTDAARTRHAAAYQQRNFRFTTAACFTGDDYFLRTTLSPVSFLAAAARGRESCPVGAPRFPQYC